MKKLIFIVVLHKAKRLLTDVLAEVSWLEAFGLKSILRYRVIVFRNYCGCHYGVATLPNWRGLSANLFRAYFKRAQEFHIISCSQVSYKLKRFNFRTR